ncbi:MAG: GNAT family N-acetyltransferase [Clostridia bacterium]|nr:GNAT family N-acetyltransferase [Clostridia bacterium]
MLHVYPLKDTDSEIFKKLFKDYYAELDCADDTAHLVDEYIIPDMIAGLLHVDLIADGAVSGFVIYQIDDINNEWNFKEGWGDIREIYITPSRRRQGLGKFLLFTAEMKLKEAGAKKSYCLPYEGAAAFFTACGYSDSSEYCEDLDCTVFEKNNLNNCCK